MIFGVPKEVRPLESRVGLTPVAVDSLIRAGHQVYVEQSAGERAGFSNDDFEAVGAHVVYSPQEAYGRADVVLKVGRPIEDEYKYFISSQTIFSFLHLAVASKDLLNTLLEKEITAIGYETIEADDETLPILKTTSEIAGRMAPIIAGELLDSLKGGRGILLSGVPGTPSAAVVILGAGVLGTNAARIFNEFGTQVTLIDENMEALQKIDEMFAGKIATMFANPHNIAKAVAFADVLICTAAKPGEKAPILVTREMLRKMNPRTVLIDFAINSGGNAETSHPTTLANPSYVEEGIIHYCVPNVPSRVARTGSYAHSNAILPYLLEIGESDIESAIESIPELKRGLNTLKGKLVHPRVAAEVGMKIE